MSGIANTGPSNDTTSEVSILESLTLRLAIG